jgi:uncharacterized membrane protein YhhN
MSPWLWKPLASTAFLVFAWKMGAFDSLYGRLIFSGLALSWLGDLFLIPASKKTFLLGLAAFLLAHIAYAGAFAERGFDPSWGTVSGVLLVMAAFAVSLWLVPAVRKTDPGMIPPVLAYMAAITAMVALAAAASGRSGDFRILAGALMFYVSDLSVARDRFVSPGWINRAWGLPLYYAAQFVLAATVSGGG